MKIDDKIQLESFLKSLSNDIKDKEALKLIEQIVDIDRIQTFSKKIFETLTGKNAIWNESETKNFKDWKNRLYKKYKKDTGRNPYFKGNLTQNYKKYLKNLIKSFSNPL